MKQGKEENMDEGRKKFLRSLDWATDVLNRYFDGKLNKQEEEIVEAQLKSIDRQSESKKGMSDKQLTESDERIRKQVFLRLNIEDPEKEEEKPTEIPSKQHKPTFIPLFRKYAAVAAIFAAVIVTTYFIFNERPFVEQEQVTSIQEKTLLVQTGDSEIKELTFPDGTKVLVNGGSRVEYIKNRYNEDKREIWLEGEEIGRAHV